MRPIKFTGHNRVFAEHQPEYIPLPAFVADDRQGTIVCCWQLSWKERLQLLITGKLWHSVLTFGHPLQPQVLSTVSLIEIP